MSKKDRRNKKKMAEEKKGPTTGTEEEELEVLEQTDKAEETNSEEKENKQEFEPLTLTAEEVKALKEKLDKLQSERDDAIKQAQRLQAEFENFRKRNASISQDSRDDGLRETVKALLPIVDNFERALKNAPDDSFGDGVRNIKKQLDDVLTKLGVEEIPAEGAFDPNLHDAVMKEAADGIDPGQVTAVLQKGYRVKGKIIRYAMVRVSE